ncbi:Thioesterase/thiol ester dehydrase-isomerase [Thozetella sp. PMI_491]|nr:Thioesterase/thiol ester dehydrase-isomerase [Thozetella sp. PMI_491]
MASSSAQTAASSPEIVAHVQKVWDGIRPRSPIYNILLSNIRLVSASHGRIIAHLDLEPVHLNGKNILHGAVSGTIIDWAGGMAIASTGLDKTGVSADIHISYVSGAREGDTLEIEAWINKVGKSLGFTQVEIRKAPKDGVPGTVVVTGSHTKFVSYYQPPSSS